ncbi:MAG: hypothetical protein GY757_36365 [bacterium]|nr:hypothetical protein [bacterium]
MSKHVDLHIILYIVLLSVTILFLCLPGLAHSPGAATGTAVEKPADSPGPAPYKDTGDRTVRKLRREFFLADNSLVSARKVLKFREQLALTDNQIEKLEDIMLTHETFSIRNGAEIKIQELRFASYLRSSHKNIDRKNVAKHIRKISKKKTDMIVQYMNYLLDVRAILTPAQKAIVKEIKAKIEKEKKEERKRKRSTRKTQEKKKKKRRTQKAQKNREKKQEV